MRRIGLTQTCGAGLLGMISALALLAAAPSVSAQQTETSAPAAQAPSGASVTSGPSVTPGAATAPNAAPAAASAPKAGALPAPAAKPAILRAAGGDEGTRATTTKYSRKQKNGAGMSASASVAGTSGEPAPNSVLCQAGCDQQPGEIVHVQDGAAVQPVVALAATQADSKAAPETIACMGGCDSGGNTFAGVPNGIESTYMTTQGKLPGASKPTSGEWMTRINRERAPDQRR